MLVCPRKAGVFSEEKSLGRSPHQTLDALTVGVQRKRMNWVLDADIRGLFDNLSHEWTMKFIEHRVADRRAGLIQCAYRPAFQKRLCTGFWRRMKTALRQKPTESHIAMHES